MTKQPKTFEELVMDGSGATVTVDSVTVTQSNGSTISFGERSPIDKAVRDLRENFEFSDFHEERVRKLFENDESLLDDLNHLVIAGSVVISDVVEVKSGGLKAYEMGNKLIIEEKQDDGWVVARTIGIQIAQILAHARAKKRVTEIEELVGGLGSDPMDRLDELPDGNHGPDINPNPGGGIHTPPTTKPWWEGGNDVRWTDGTSDMSKFRNVVEQMRELKEARAVEGMAIGRRR